VIAGTYNLNIDQGATFERTITVKNPDGSLFDLSGYSARMQIREEIDSAEFQVELTTDNGGITLGDTDGTIDLYMSHSVTSTLDDEGVYDIELVAPNGKVSRLLKGKVRVDYEVTR
jgi:hypothetical protein